jgi:hypothetical protein
VWALALVWQLAQVLLMLLLMGLGWVQAQVLLVSSRELPAAEPPGLQQADFAHYSLLHSGQRSVPSQSTCLSLVNMIRKE